MRHIKHTILQGAIALLFTSFLVVGCDDAAQSDDVGTAEQIEETTAAPAPVIEIDVQAALKERILGNPDAPIKISEHSSLTCGHCGHFHQTTFPQLKEQYIETGKAYLVFSDFPLNAPAFHATLSSRCVPEDRYFDYIQDLFEHQEEWAYEPTYLSYLKQKAGAYGLNEATFEACLANEDLQKGIMERVRENQTKYNLSSTPSFVINETEVFSGALSMEDFEKRLIDTTNPPAPEADETQDNPETTQPQETEEPSAETPEEIPTFVEPPTETQEPEEPEQPLEEVQE